MYKADQTTLEMAQNLRFEPESITFVPKSMVRKVPPAQLQLLARYFAGFENLKRSDWKRIYELGLAEIFHITEEEAIEIIKHKSPQQISDTHSVYLQKCEWCKCSTYVLNGHHYPKRKKEGGGQTVNICSNCHMEFHFLVDNPHYRLKKEIEYEFVEGLRQAKENLIRENVLIDQYLDQQGGVL